MGRENPPKMFMRRTTCALDSRFRDLAASLDFSISQRGV
jgi:hypothetical protein